jgi:hypothetical protein
MRRCFAIAAILVCLLAPVASFADNSILEPPIGSHSIPQPHHRLTGWDLFAVLWLEWSLARAVV